MTNIKLLSNPGKYLFLCSVTLAVLGISLPGQAKEVTQKYNGLTLNANLEMVEGKDFKDGMAIILHGYMAHNKMEIIRTAQQVLLGNERSSLAINLSLGVDNRHGYYDCSLPQRHIQGNAIYELGAWVAWLRERGTSQVTILGHSRGANQAMVYAVENIDPEVTHMIMMAPGAGDEVKDAYWERYGYSLDQPLTFAYEQIASGKGDELMKGIDMLSCPKSSITANSFVSYYSENNKFRQFRTYLSKSPIPTLIITGTEDERQPNTVELITSYTGNEHIRVAVIGGAGHFFRDLNMDEAIESAIEFIDE